MSFLGAWGHLVWQLLGPQAFLAMIILLAGLVITMFVLRFTLGEALMASTLLAVGFAAPAINQMFESMKILALVINGLVFAYFVWQQIAKG